MGTIRERPGKLGKTYHCQVRRKGAEPVTKTFRTKAEAQRWVRRVEADIDAGVYVNRKPAEGTTLLDALTRFKEEVTPHRKSRIQEVSLINTMSRVRIARRSLDSLRSSDFSALRDAWIKEEVKPATIARRLSLFSKIFKVCKTDWGLESLQNPLRDVSRPAVNNDRDRLVERGDEETEGWGAHEEVDSDIDESDPSDSAESDGWGDGAEVDSDGDEDDEDDEDDESEPLDREAVLDEIEHIAAASRSPVLKIAMRFAALTALRRSEIAGLTWANVNLKIGQVRMPTTKNGAARKPMILPEACELLKSIPWKRQGRVFPVRADALTRAFIRARNRARKSYVDGCAVAGQEPSKTFLVGLRFHDLRHEATTMLATHVPLPVLAKITGHKDMKMLLRYYHPKPADIARMFPLPPQKHG